MLSRSGTDQRDYIYLAQSTIEKFRWGFFVFFSKSLKLFWG